MKLKKTSENKNTMNTLHLLYRDIRLSANKRFMIVVTDNLVWEDITEFTDYEDGVIYVTPSRSRDNTPCYIVIVIDRMNHIIQYCSTRGDTLNCDAFNALCNLEDNGEPFICLHYKYKTDRYDEVFAVYLAKLFCPDEETLISSHDMGYLKSNFFRWNYDYKDGEEEKILKSNIPYRDLKRLPFKEIVDYQDTDKEDQQYILERHKQELKKRAQRLKARARRVRG